MTDTVLADDIALLANITARDESRSHKLKQEVRDIGFYAKANKTKNISFNWGDTIEMKIVGI